MKLIITALCLMAAAATAEPLVWYYNPSRQPSAFDTQRVESAIRNGLSEWGACASGHTYGGQTTKTVPSQGEALVMWSTHLDFANTVTRSNPSRPLYAKVQLNYERLPYHASMLEWLVTHEIGHGLGINNHDPYDSGSVMYQKATEKNRYPSQGDIARCLKEVPATLR